MRLLLANFAKMNHVTGGLAKVTCAFANEMVRRGHEVFLAYMDEGEGEFFYPVEQAVKTYNLCRMQERNIRFPLRLKLKRELLRHIDIRRAREVNDEFIRHFLLARTQIVLEETKPDIIISSQPAASRLLLCDLHTKVPVVTMSHGDPEDYFHTYPRGELPALGKSAACQVLMPSFAQAIRKRFPDVRIEVIGNVVPQYEIQADLEKKKERHKILFLGRLVRNHKRPHLLIEAFGRLAREFPDWEVELWGESDRRTYTEELRRQIRKYGLSRQVFLKGVTRNVSEVLRQGDIFVFPSAYEGFGLSLAEAMSMGLPAVGYRSCPAVNEMIEDSVNGFLCEDGAAPLAEKMAILMKDAALRCWMGEQARKSMQKYGAEHIWMQWEALMEDLVHPKDGIGA